MATKITNAQFERLIVEFSGIRKALEALVTANNALAGEESPLNTIAAKLDPLYMAEYVAPEPADDGEGGGGEDTPPADDNEG